MKKLGFLVLLVGWSVSLQAQKLPDNMYFKAMQDEMTRTLKHLKRPGAPRPFYVAYKLEHIISAPAANASLGALYTARTATDMLNAYVVLNIGTPQADSLGYAHDSYRTQYAYMPTTPQDLARSYYGIRQALWAATDEAYTYASELYQQKQAYQRLKNLPPNGPDFVPGKQAHYVQEIPPFTPPEEKQLQTWAQELSALGKDKPHIENFGVRIAPKQKNTYYLNSLGGFFQTSRTVIAIEWVANIRTQDGHKKDFSRRMWLEHTDGTTAQTLHEQTDEILRELAQLYAAKKGETYIGPVLLTPPAAGNLLRTLLVQNLQNINPLLSAKRETDPTAGKLRGNVGLRVLSNVADVYDRPQQTHFNGVALSGFLPVDDEGVRAQELPLVLGGKLRTLPRTGRPLEKGDKTNGHAYMTLLSFPRERLTNVFIEAKQPINAAQLEEQLLKQCRALELEYCYILPVFPAQKDPAEILYATRVYSKDGRKETVYGLKLNELTPRALRDIMAAGDDPHVVHSPAGPYENPAFPVQSVVTPSLLIEEMELVPDDVKPDKKPFVKRP